MFRRTALTLILALILVTPIYAIPTLNMVETTTSDFDFSGITYGLLGDGHVYDYASHVDFFSGDHPDSWLSGYWIGSNPNNYLTQLDWGHTLPNGLAVPPDEVTRAKLYIDAWAVGSDDNLVRIEGLMEWDPLNHYLFDNTSFDLTYVDTPDFWNDGTLDVTVFAGERSLRIDRAILMMDYNSAPVPEPATLLFVGAGLLGMGIIRRKKN